MCISDCGLEPTRVGFVIDALQPGAGTENQLLLMIHRFDWSTVKPMVFVLRGDLKRARVDSIVPVFNLGISSVCSFSGVFGIIRLAYLLRKYRIDVVQTYFVDANVVGVLAGFLARTRAIIFTRRNVGWWYTKRRLSVIRRVNKLAHYCLVNSHSIIDVVANIEGFPREKISYLPNIAQELRTDFKESNVRNRLHLPLGKRIVICVSNLRKVKRLDRLLEIAERLIDEEVCFLVVGKGSEEKELREATAKRGLNGHVYFATQEDSVDDLLRVSSVGILMSESEGLSNALIEYGMAGLPAIAFDVGGNAEVIIDGATGFIVPDGNLELFEIKLRLLLKDSVKATAMGVSARRQAVERFEVTKAIRLYEEFYFRISSK